MDLLEAIGTVASSELSLEDTVERLLELLVPAFADLATLDSEGFGGEPRRLGARVDAPRRVELEQVLMRRRRAEDDSVGAGRASATSESQLLSPLQDEHLRRVAGSDTDLELLRSLQLSSAVLVPLRARGRRLGVLSCAVGGSGRGYDESDLRFSEVLARRIALALDHAGLSATVSSLEQRLEATLTNLAEAVLVRNPQARIVYANPAAVRLFQAASAEELTQSPAAEFNERFDVSDEHGRPLSLQDMPSVRLFRGERPGPVLVRNIVRSSGEERWLRYKASPVYDDQGQVILSVVVIEDVTEVKRAELAQRLLAEAGRALSSSLEYGQTLQRVAELAVPELADWCGVAMPAPDGLLRQVAVAHADPEKVALARDFGERSPARLDDPTGAAEVIRSGTAQLVREITPELIAAAELEDEQLKLISDLHMRSVIIVPLAVAGQRPIGAMSLVMAESGRVFDADDLALAEELGRRAATAVENARLYSERSHIARTLQQSLLPAELPRVPGWSLASLYRAAGDQNEVGGDFYDVFATRAGWMLVVGDVCGRGAEAAALTSLARYTLRAAARFVEDPVAAIGCLHDALRERPQLSLVSVCCALICETDGRAEAHLVLAGHPPAYLIRDGVPREIGVYGPLPGAFGVSAWRESRIGLEDGDQLILYTDGVTDTLGAVERFGQQRLTDVLAGASGATDAVRRIERGLSDFERGPQADDTAILAVERVGSESPSEGNAALSGSSAVGL